MGFLIYKKAFGFSFIIVDTQNPILYLFSMAYRKHKLISNCECCNKFTGLTRHHIVPHQYTRVNPIPNNVCKLCEECHIILHQYYTNEHLARHVNTKPLIVGAIEAKRAEWEARKANTGWKTWGERMRAKSTGFYRGRTFAYVPDIENPFFGDRLC